MRALRLIGWAIAALWAVYELGRRSGRRAWLEEFRHGYDDAARRTTRL